MSKTKKFCPNCGEQVAIEENFCPNCGFNFATRELPEEALESTNNQETFSFKNLDLKNFNFSDLNKKQWSLIGGAAVVLMALIYLFVGNLSIAGTYESEDTLGDPDHETRFEISENGKTQITEEDRITGDVLSFTIYLEESGDKVYIADLAKGIDVEATTSAGYGDYAGLVTEMSPLFGMMNLDIEDNGDSYTVKGSFTDMEARNADLIDLREVYIVEHGDNLLIDGNLFIKR